MTIYESCVIAGAIVIGWLIAMGVADKERMKAKARQLYAGSKHPERLADHLTICSGPCCGNPRKHFGEPTVQERRQLQDEE